eukprot:COSAG02_NODE_19001_length_906_cov_0.876084_1_plen_259_part_10
MVALEHEHCSLLDNPSWCVERGIEAFGLSNPVIRPCSCGDSFFSQARNHFVRLQRVMKGFDLKSKFMAESNHHLLQPPGKISFCSSIPCERNQASVGIPHHVMYLVAVIVQSRLASEQCCDRVQRQVLRTPHSLPLPSCARTVPIILRTDQICCFLKLFPHLPCRAHASVWKIAVVFQFCFPLRILTAGHFEPTCRAAQYQVLNGCAVGIRAWTTLCSPSRSTLRRRCGLIIASDRSRSARTQTSSSGTVTRSLLVRSR